jgi:hypothetical protein
MIASTRFLIPPSAVNSLAGVRRTLSFSRPNLVAFFYIFCYAIPHVHVLLFTNHPLLRIHERPIVYFQLIDQL